MVHCINAPKDLEEIIEIEEIGSLMTFVDASFSMYDSLCGHTGLAITFGVGSLITESKTQCVNSKSSTERKLVGADDYLPRVV